MRYCIILAIVMFTACKTSDRSKLQTVTREAPLNISQLRLGVLFFGPSQEACFYERRKTPIVDNVIALNDHGFTVREFLNAYAEARELQISGGNTRDVAIATAANAFTAVTTGIGVAVIVSVLNTNTLTERLEKRREQMNQSDIEALRLLADIESDQMTTIPAEQYNFALSLARQASRLAQSREDAFDCRSVDITPAIPILFPD